MDIKIDKKYVVRDFIGVSGNEVRLPEGQTFGEFLKNKKYGQTNQGIGKTNTESKGEESNTEEKGDAEKAV